MAPTPNDLKRKRDPPPEEEGLQFRKQLEATMTEAEQEEAARMARIAARAEERALERARIRRREAEEAERASRLTSTPVATNGSATPGDAAPAKPKFKSKKQREKEALEKVEHQRKEQQAKVEAQRQQRATFFRSQQRQGRYDDSRRGRGSWKHDRYERDQGGPAADSKGSAASASTEDARVLEAIKQQYLGKKEEKKRVARASEKFSKIFQFDWDASEDTSKDLNPIYSSRAEASLLFGRGYRGGVDKREQRKNSDYLLKLMNLRHNGKLTDAQLAAKKRELDALERAQTQATEVAVKHWQDKRLDEMDKRDWRIVREDFDIYVKGGRIPNPARNWDELKLPGHVMQAITSMGFTKPSPIQMQAIPIGLKQRDIIGVAETGSGKTAAFVIPLLVYLTRQTPETLESCAEDGPLAVIMAPTRELAQQIEEQTQLLAKFTNIKSVSVVGGNSIQDQGFKLRQGCQVVVATPGRLLDCLRNHYVVFNQCNYLVLDEADRMIDMGFEPQVEAVIQAMNCGMKSDIEEEVIEQERLAVEGKKMYRITIMFSATMPPEVERLAQKYMRFPATVKIGDKDSGKNRNIEQRVFMVSEAGKKSKLLQLVREKRSRTIVFANAKKGCDAVAKILKGAGYRAVAFHSSRSQEQRESYLKGFKEGQYDYLVATDVAGRGLDIDDIKHVINFDMSSDIERYTHRIGRTGRAGKRGVASTLLTEDDSALFYPLVEYLKSTKSAIPNDLAKHPMSSIKPGDFVDPKVLNRWKKRQEGR